MPKVQLPACSHASNAKLSFTTEHVAEMIFTTEHVAETTFTTEHITEVTEADYRQLDRQTDKHDSTNNFLFILVCT